VTGSVIRCVSLHFVSLVATIFTRELRVSTDIPPCFICDIPTATNSSTRRLTRPIAKGHKTPYNQQQTLSLSPSWSAPSCFPSPEETSWKSSGIVTHECPKLVRVEDAEAQPKRFSARVLQTRIPKGCARVFTCESIGSLEWRVFFSSISDSVCWLIPYPGNSLPPYVVPCDPPKQNIAVSVSFFLGDQKRTCLQNSRALLFSLRMADMFGALKWCRAGVWWFTGLPTPIDEDKQSLFSPSRIGTYVESSPSYGRYCCCLDWGCYFLEDRNTCSSFKECLDCTM